MTDDLVHRIGRRLRPVRAGISGIVSRAALFAGVPDTIDVSSSEFGPGGAIDSRFSADGEGVSPPLAWSNLPAGTKSVMLLAEDADIPFLWPLVHAMMIGIAPSRTSLAAGEIPHRIRGGLMSDGVLVGRNGFGRCGWLPPSPPPGHGPHRYVFQVFALDAEPHFEWPPGRGYAIRKLRPHIIARGSLIGLYERP